MKRHILPLFISLVLASNLNAQTPVDWSVNYDATNSQVVMKAEIEEGWHIYSQYVNSAAGPIPTSFTFAPNKKVKIKGKTKEPKPIEEYDHNFEANLLFFENKVEFTQPVKVKENTVYNLTITYMVCNEEMCLPPVDVPFELNLAKQL